MEAADAAAETAVAHQQPDGAGPAAAPSTVAAALPTRADIPPASPARGLKGGTGSSVAPNKQMFAYRELLCRSLDGRRVDLLSLSGLNGLSQPHGPGSLDAGTAISTPPSALEFKTNYRGDVARPPWRNAREPHLARAD